MKTGGLRATPTPLGIGLTNEFGNFDEVDTMLMDVVSTVISPQ
jgi:hypothetical protein